MTTLDFVKAKMLITNACNSTGLELGELVGVLSSVLEEAWEQMNYELASDVLKLTEENERLKEMIPKKEVDTNGNSDAKG